jgi:hypothetical protein
MLRGVHQRTAPAGNRRFWLSSRLRAHTKAPYKTDLLWETLRVLNRPGRARTAAAVEGLSLSDYALRSYLYGGLYGGCMRGHNNKVLYRTYPDRSVRPRRT